MRYLRHFPLLVWFTALAALAGVLVLAWAVGRDQPARVPTPAAHSRADVDAAMQLRSTMSSLPALTAVGGDSLALWAHRVSVLAADAAGLPGLPYQRGDAFRSVQRAAAALQEQADSDQRTRDTAARRLAEACDRLAAAVTGTVAGTSSGRAELTR